MQNPKRAERIRSGQYHPAEELRGLIQQLRQKLGQFAERRWRKKKGESIPRSPAEQAAKGC